MYTLISDVIERLQLRHKLTSRTLPCGKKNVSGMAKTSERHLSEVYHKLEPKAKERYLEKIAYIRSEDPYTLRKADFSKDISVLPSLR